MKSFPIVFSFGIVVGAFINAPIPPEQQFVTFMQAEIEKLSDETKALRAEYDYLSDPNLEV